MKLHHIGIVVPKICDSLGELTKFIKFEQVSIPINVVTQKVNACFLQTGSVYLELIEPVGDNSPVENFLNTGGGIHHICFEVQDIQETIDQMKNEGATLIVSPVKGFEDRQIAFLFLNMKNTNCNLIELAEEKKV